MIYNSDVTIYHKIYNSQLKRNEWKRHYYKKCWWFGGKGASINKGYDNASDVDVRIPLEVIENPSEFVVGDILVKGNKGEIDTQQDLKCDFYNIVGININDFGRRKHIHFKGK